MAQQARGPDAIDAAIVHASRQLRSQRIPRRAAAARCLLLGARRAPASERPVDLRRPRFSRHRDLAVRHLPQRTFERRLIDSRLAARRQRDSEHRRVEEQTLTAVRKSPGAAAACRASVPPSTIAADALPSDPPPYAYSTFTFASLINFSAGASDPG